MNKYVEHLLMQKYIDVSAIPNVRRYIGYTIKGNSIDYRSPILSSLTRGEVMNLLRQEVLDDKFIDEYPWIATFEEDMLAKVGPLSVQKPWVDREEDLKNYYDDIKIKSIDFTDDDIRDVCSFFHARRNIRLRCLSGTYYNMKKSTSSGTPFLKPRRDVGMLTLELMTNSHVDLTDILEYPETLGSFRMGAIIGWRGQEGGIEPDDVKQRVVFQFPLSVNILELSVYQPLIQYIQKLGIIPAYISVDRVDQEITSLFDSKPDSQLVICTDFTRFDQHFNPSMQKAAYKVLTEMLANNENNRVWMEFVWPCKYTICAITPNKVYTGPHGMASGSGGTNFDECIAHKALQFHAARCAGQILNPHSMAYGDDGILTFPGISPEFIEQIYKQFGQDVNQSKFHVSRDTAIVLRRVYHSKYRIGGIMRGVYSIFRAMNHIISQERYFNPKVWSKEMVTLRVLSILENCKWHPRFHKLIDFVLKWDKYKLGLLIPGFYENLSKFVSYAKRNVNSMFSYNQDVQDITSGIQGWSVVKYVLSKTKQYS